MEQIDGCAIMEDVIIQVGDMFTDNRTRKHLLQNVETLTCLMNNQTVRFPDALRDKTCRKLKAWFPRNCKPVVTEDCCTGDDDSCEIPFSPDTVPVECYEYAPNFCRTVKFGAMDDQCDSKITMEEVLRESMAKAERQLIEDLNEAMLVEVTSKVKPIEIDPLCSDFTTDPDTGAIVVPQSYWNGDLVYDLQNLVSQLEMNDYMAYSGSLLAKELWKAGKNGAGCCENEAAKYNDLPDICFNKKQDQQLGEKCMLFVEKGALGIFSVHEYPNQTPIERKAYNGNTFVYSKQLGNLTWRNGNQTLPVMVDVSYQIRCKTVTFKDGTCAQRYGIAGKMKLRAGIICAPEDCDGFNGIVKFVCK